jgi:hypothetical protein
MVEASKMGRADALCALERATAVEARGPGTIVKGITTFRIKPRGAGPIQTLLEGALEYHRGGYLEAARIAEASPIADPLQPQSE